MTAVEQTTVSEHHISGVVARVLDQPRQPPEVLDDAERGEWLEGYDA